MSTLDSAKNSLNEYYYKKNSKTILQKFYISFKEDMSFEKMIFAPEENDISEQLHMLIGALFLILKHKKDIDWIEVQFAFQVKEKKIKFSKKMQIPKYPSYDMIKSIEKTINTLPELYEWTDDIEYDDIQLLISNYSNMNKDSKNPPLELLNGNEKSIVYISKNPWFYKENPIYPKNLELKNTRLHPSFLRNLEYMILAKNAIINISYKKDIQSKKPLSFPESIFFNMKGLEEFLKQPINDKNPLYKCIFQIQLKNKNWINLTEAIHLYKLNPKDLPSFSSPSSSSLPKVLTFQEILNELSKKTFYRNEAIKEIKNINDIRIQLSISPSHIEFQFH